MCVVCSSSSFAVSVSERNRKLSEYGFRMLRVEMPSRELNSVDVLRKIIWKMFINHRYNNVAIHDVLVRLQTVIRMYIAKRRVQKMLEHSRDNQ